VKSPSLRDIVTNLIIITRKRETFFAALAMFTYAVSFATIFGFFPLYGEKLGLTPTLIGFLITARIFASTIVRPLAGMLTKRVNSLNLMIRSLIPCSVVLFVLPFLDSFYLLLGALSLEGLCYGILLISSNTLIAETSNKNEMGATMGLWATAEHAGTAVGPFILGFIGERWGLNALFRSAFLIMMVGILYLEINRRSLPPGKQS
jgi:MFS family permease